MRIGVIGLGYVGLPLAVEFLEAGHEVVGVDPVSSPDAAEMAKPELDLEKILAAAPLVVDFRGVTRGTQAANLVRL